MKRYILGSIVTAALLVGCGSGSGGGPVEAAITKAENTMVVTVGNETGDVKKYRDYEGTGDQTLSVNLDKEGLYIISFAHQSYSSSRKIDDAILTVRRDGKVVQYLTRKSLDNLEEDTRLLSEFFVYPGESGIYTFEVNTPENLDNWILDLGHKDDFPDNLKAVLEDKIPVSSQAGSDILYKYQWHLKNDGSNYYSNISPVQDEDINVEPVWNYQNVTGRGVKIAVLDEGVEINHPDLIDNIDLDLSWNYINNSHDTTPSNPANAHGTAVAGIIAAKANNGIGGRGVAPDATIVSYNMLESESITSFDNALESLIRNKEQIDIYNNSWGYGVTGELAENTTFGLYQQFANQLRNGTIYGRNGNGSIYVKSAGNDRALDWNANYGFEQVERYMIVVGASGADGFYSLYSTPGENLLVNAPGGSSQPSYLEVDEQMIVTTDLTTNYKGYDSEAYYDLQVGHFDVSGNENYDYTNRMNGTSSAGPIVAGVVALMLEVNPNLSWREVRYILAKTAQPLWSNRDIYSVTYLPTLNYDPDYGFGRVNAKLAVELAKYYRDYNISLSDEIMNYREQSGELNSTTGTNPSATVSFDFSSTTIDQAEYVNVEFSIDEVNQVEYNFSNDNNSQEIEDGVYTVTFNITDVVDEDGVLLTVPEDQASISIGGSTFDVPLDIRGGVILEPIVVENVTISGGLKNISPSFTGSQGEDVVSHTWEMKLKKGAPIPTSNKFEVVLTSNDGTQSVLIPYNESEETNGLNTGAKFYKTRMGANRFLDKDPSGIWQLNIQAKDLDNEAAFSLEDAKVEIYGR